MLTHAVKHGRAESVSVVLSGTGGTARAEITDDGRGGTAEGGGTGLRGIRQRVEAVHGVLEVRSPPGGPTVITAACPYAS
ncbi:ATP-binding protein [Streptomyces tendae]|uniref:ATP-binding protein n=1 Tax=Streptomyces tendae TaxID=1932 RepID=UPI0033BE95D1